MNKNVLGFFDRTQHILKYDLTYDLFGHNISNMETKNIELKPQTDAYIPYLWVSIAAYGHKPKDNDSSLVKALSIAINDGQISVQVTSYMTLRVNVNDLKHWLINVAMKDLPHLAIKLYIALDMLSTTTMNLGHCENLLSHIQ